MAQSFTRCANFRGLLSKADCPQALKNCEPMFRKLVNPQLRSTLITDMASFSGCVDENEDVGLPEHSMTLIPVDIYNALRTLRSFPLPRRAEMLSHLTIKGVMYTVASKHLGNSCVLISSADCPPFPAQIHSILRLHTPDTVEAFVAVQCYKPVHVADPYTRYPALRAKIWGREMAKDVEIMSVDDIQCHFAACPILWDGSAVNVVISLSRVCIHPYLDAIYTHLFEGIRLVHLPPDCVCHDSHDHRPHSRAHMRAMIFADGDISSFG
jgi:hypothetical protein